MSNLIKIKRGLNLPLIGEADATKVVDVESGCVCSIYPDDYCGLTPKIAIKEGDTVKAGESIIYDKNDNDICLVSPVSGTVVKVVRGERRKIERVEILPSNTEDAVTFSIDEKSKENIIRILKVSGLWAKMRQRPYDIIPESGKTPRDIFVSTFDSAPLAIEQLCKADANFNKGIEILSKLTEGKVYIGCRGKLIETPHSESFLFEGPHPAGNIGVQIEKIKPVNKGETVWAVTGDIVSKIGYLFNMGTLDFSCTLAITGEGITAPCLVKATEGADIKSILGNNLNIPVEEARIISGNILTGHKVSFDGHIRFPYRQVTVIKEITERDEFMGWASLSPKKYSFSRTFLSWLCKRPYRFDAKINGGERAIIMAGEYDKVQPMDIYFEFLVKAILAHDIDKMEQLGIYEVAPEDFALCEFIDTSKLELQKIVREGLDYLRKELN